MGDSQAGSHDEPTAHLGHAQPTTPAGGIQDNQPKNAELLRVKPQGALQAGSIPALQPKETVCPGDCPWYLFLTGYVWLSAVAVRACVLRVKQVSWLRIALGTGRLWDARSKFLLSVSVSFEST